MNLATEFIPAQTFQLNRSRKMIGQNVSHVMLFADKVDKNDRFAIITTGEKVVKYTHSSQIQLI